MLETAELRSAKKNAHARKIIAALILYSGGVALWIIACSLGHAPKFLATNEFAAFAFVPPFALLATFGHVTGKAPGRGGSAERARDPFLFWILISFYWLCATGLLTAGISCRAAG
jgi:hypothetical protein